MSTEKRLTSYINKYSFIFGFGGLLTSVIQNGLLKRPVLSGVHRHFLYTVFGASLGSFLGIVEKTQFGKRDLYIEDYIERHPEDFKKESCKKMGEVYEIWTPTQPTQ